jgi:hypothetical protein
VPVGQVLQDVRSGTGIWPAAQYVHVDAPASEIVPLPQSVHLALVPSPDLPAWHGVQPVSAVTVQFEEMNFPTAQVLHEKHDDWPTSGWKLTRSMHSDCSPPVHPCPAGQGSSDERAVGRAVVGVVKLPPAAMLTVAELAGQKRAALPHSIVVFDPSGQK